MPLVFHAVSPTGPACRHRPRRCGTLVAAAMAMAVKMAVALVSAAAAAEEPPAPPPDAARIGQLIEQLGSPQFAQREAATRGLVESGRTAIGPLGEAIAGDDLEVSSRAIEIVRGFLASDDPDLAAEAEKFLESAAEGPNQTVSQLADDTLDFHMLGMAEAAREKLESLGAVVAEGFLPSGRRGLQVVLNSSWRGSTEDLRLLSRLRGVAQLGVHGVRLDRAALAVLGRMRTMERLELYGTGASDEELAALEKKLPEARIDVRKGGKLGVGGQPTIGPCLITHVQDGSAAAKAGVQIGDIVLEIDGDPVANFEALTGKVARHGPGDALQVEIERVTPGGPERITHTIQLDGW